MRFKGHNLIDSTDSNDLLTVDMDLPQLENAIKALEQRLDSLGVWLIVSTAVVVLGLILEFAFDEDLKRLITERPFKWRLFLTIVGVFLITIGVAGELFVQFKASKVETNLRTNSHQVEALLNRLAAEANKKAEGERLARLQLEGELTWRRISEDNQSAVASRLVRFSGQTAQISYSAGDLEAQSFALSIASALQAAKWEVSEPEGIANLRQVLVALGRTAPFESGVTVTSTKDRTSRGAADAIMHELSVLGFDVTLSRTGFPQATSIFVAIFVAHRPDGLQGEFKRLLREQKKSEPSKPMARLD